MGDHRVGQLMMRVGHGPIRQLQDLNWGAFDHASHAPQLRSCNYNIHVQQNSVLYHVTTVCVSSNQSFYRQFAGYGKGMGHHKVGQ